MFEKYMEINNNLKDAHTILWLGSGSLLNYCDSLPSFEGLRIIQLGESVTDCPTRYCFALFTRNSAGNRRNLLVISEGSIYTNISYNDGWLGWRVASTTLV